MTTVPATTPTATLPSATPSNSAGALQDLSQNYTTFLKLLTTQLQNQDPLNPMDSSQFTSQLVQFSSVEQQIQANKNLETLIQAQSTNAANSAVNYIGMNVAATSSQIGLSNGTATINYALDSNAAQTTITISDSKGKTVQTLTGDTSQGAHSITWDGTDSGGKKLADGVYNIAISAANADQTAASATIGISGVVTGVALVNQQPMLAIGGVTVPLANVLSVTAPSSLGL